MMARLGQNLGIKLLSLFCSFALFLYVRKQQKTELSFRVPLTINLDPTIGSEIKKIRPCVIVSPDEMNRYLRTVIVAPMTTKGQSYPTRVSCRFAGKHGQIVLDQIRAVDRARLVKRLGKLQPVTHQQLLATLAELFAP